jgi:hypothetical protein
MGNSCQVVNDKEQEYICLITLKSTQLQKEYNGYVHST